MASTTLTSLSINNDDSILLKKKQSRKKHPLASFKPQNAWVCNHSSLHKSKESLKKSKSPSKTLIKSPSKPIFSVRNINSLSKSNSPKKQSDVWCCDHSRKREHTVPLIRKEKSQLLTDRTNLSRNMSSLFESSNFKSKKCSTPNSNNYSILSKNSLSFKSPAKKKPNCITRFFKPLNSRLKQMARMKRPSPVNKKSVLTKTFLNTITEPFTIDVIKKDAFIQTETDSQLIDLKRKMFENNLNALSNQIKEETMVIRSKSDSVIILKKNVFTNMKEKLMSMSYKRNKTDIVTPVKSLKSNSDVDCLSDLKSVKQNNRCNFRPIMITRAKTFSQYSERSFASLRPIFSRSLKTNCLRRFDSRRHSISGSYEAQKLNLIKENLLKSMALNEHPPEKTELKPNTIEVNPFKIDSQFTNNAIFKYLKSNSDSKFLANEELFVINTNNSNNNKIENKKPNLVETSSHQSDFIDSGKTKLGLQFERFFILFTFKIIFLFIN